MCVKTAEFVWLYKELSTLQEPEYKCTWNPIKQPVWHSMDKHEREMQRTCHGVAVQRTDLEEACKEKTSPLISLRPQGDIERNVYLQTLTRGAWDHFHQHAPTKSNAALEEFIETCAGIPTSLDDFRAEDFPNVSNYFERIAQAREG